MRHGLHYGSLLTFRGEGVLHPLWLPPHIWGKSCLCWAFSAENGISVYMCWVQGEEGGGTAAPLLCLLSAKQKRAEMLFSSAVYSAWFQAVTELGGGIFPFRSRVEKKKKNQKVIKGSVTSLNKPQRGPGRLGVIERVLGLRGLSNMRLPQKLLLWGQMSDNAESATVVTGDRGGTVQAAFLWTQVGSVAEGCAPGQGRWAASEQGRVEVSSVCELQAGQVSLPYAATKWTWGVQEMVLQVGTGRRQWEGGKKRKFLVLFCSQRSCDFLGWSELLRKRLHMRGFVHKGRIPHF